MLNSLCAFEFNVISICSEVFYLCSPPPSPTSEPWGLDIFAIFCLVIVMFHPIGQSYILHSFLFQIFQHVILDLPGLAFFTTYAMLALFWAEISYQARGLETEGLRSGFYTINGVIYVIQVKQVISKSLYWLVIAIYQILYNSVSIAIINSTPYCTSCGDQIFSLELWISRNLL